MTSTWSTTVIIAGAELAHDACTRERARAVAATSADRVRS
jgi:hypothetical protein